MKTESHSDKSPLPDAGGRRSPPPLLRTLGLRAVQAFGLLLAVLMMIPTLYELDENDFFGTSVCMLVVVFGIQLMSVGNGQKDRGAEEAERSDPLQAMWRNNDHRYPIARLSRSAGRGPGKGRSR